MEKGLSCEQIAEACGWSRYAVSLWESDVNAPKFNNILRLCEYFGVPINFFVQDVPDIVPTTKMVGEAGDDPNRSQGFAGKKNKAEAA